MIVKIKKLCPEANVPTQKPGDAGWDLYCSKRVAVSMGETVVIPVGVALEIPLGWYGQIKGRSGLASPEFSGSDAPSVREGRRACLLF